MLKGRVRTYAFNEMKMIIIIKASNVKMPVVHGTGPIDDQELGTSPFPFLLCSLFTVSFFSYCIALLLLHLNKKVNVRITGGSAHGHTYILVYII